MTTLSAVERWVERVKSEIDDAPGPKQCSKRDYAEALEEIISHAQTSLDAVRDEMDAGDDADSLEDDDEDEDVELDDE